MDPGLIVKRETANVKESPKFQPFFLLPASYFHARVITFINSINPINFPTGQLVN
jgi:hypothetical protein